MDATRRHVESMTKVSQQNILPDSSEPKHDFQRAVRDHAAVVGYTPVDTRPAPKLRPVSLPVKLRDSAFDLELEHQADKIVKDMHERNSLRSRPAASLTAQKQESTKA